MEKNSEDTIFPVKIAITGPESSGKTSLALTLAEDFREPYLEEFAREYLTVLNRPYTGKDLHRISKEQLRREAIYLETAERFLFCDTDIVVFKIWYEHKFKIVPDFIEEALLKRSYALHLLLRPDIPYEEDPLRENPELGEYFFKEFEKTLKAYNLPYVIIEGQDFQKRLKKARKSVLSLID